MRQDSGQTDAHGKFRATAKSGNWMYGRVDIFVPGYEPLAFYNNQENALNTHIYLGENNGGYPAWEAQALMLGYKISADGYFEKPYSNLVSKNVDSNIKAPLVSGGLVQYWVTTRSAPLRSALEYSQDGASCNYPPELNDLQIRAAKEHKIAFANAAKSIVCDEKWDSVSASLNTSAYLYFNFATQIVSVPAQQKALRAVVPDFHPRSDYSYESRPMTNIERVNFCAAISPYFENFLKTGTTK